jgi:hypothetical protein
MRELPNPPDYLDVACLVGLGPHSSTARNGVVYMTRQGDRSVIDLVREEDVEGRGHTMGLVPDRYWKVRGSVGFQGLSKLYKDVVPDCDVVLTFESDDMILPEAFRGFFVDDRKKFATVQDNRLVLECSDMGTQIVVGTGHRKMVSLNVKSAGKLNGKCITNILFHSGSDVIVGKSVLDDADVALSRYAVRFIPRGDKVSHSREIIDISPLEARWYRLFSARDGQWVWDPADGTGPSDFRFVKLCHEEIQMYMRSTEWSPENLIPSISTIVGDPVATVEDSGRVTLEYSPGWSVNSVSLIEESERLISVKFVLLGLRFTMHDSGNEIEFFPHTGEQAEGELVTMWPPVLERWVAGKVYLAIQAPHASRTRRLFLGQPEIDILSENRFVIKRASDSGGDSILRSDGTRLEFKGPIRRFALSSAGSNILEFVEVTGQEPSGLAEFEMKSDVPQFKQGPGGEISLTLRPLMDEMHPLGLTEPSIWQGRPVLENGPGWFRIVSDASSGLSYKFNAFEADARLVLQFVPL